MTATLSTHEPAVTRPPVQIEQYGMRTILRIWAMAALPMGAMAWLGTPWLAGTFNGPNATARALIVALTGALVWQFVLVLILVRREQGTLRWAVVKDALSLHEPESPRTGRRGGRVWFLVVPLVLAVAAKDVIPAFPSPQSRDLALFLESDSGQSFLSGNWAWFGLIVTMFLFNTVLGEELLFRGLLLPRMQGVFGRRSWIANGILFGLYHLHVPWGMHKNVLNGFIYAYGSQRCRSTLIGIAVHSVQSVVFTFLILALVLR